MTRKPVVHAGRSPPRQVNARRKDAVFREDRYVKLRSLGVPSREAAERVGLNATSGDRLEGFLRAETRVSSGDASQPQFAHDAEYIDLILDADERGFGRIEGRQLVYGRAA